MIGVYSEIVDFSFDYMPAMFIIKTYTISAKRMHT